MRRFLLALALAAAFPTALAAQATRALPRGWFYASDGVAKVFYYTDVQPIDIRAGGSRQWDRRNYHAGFAALKGWEQRAWQEWSSGLEFINAHPRMGAIDLRVREKKIARFAALGYRMERIAVPKPIVVTMRPGRGSSQ